MYFMYIDESGDPGVVNSPSIHYYLSAIIVHESFWLRLLNDAIAFRRQLKSSKGLLMKEEIHSSEFISRRVTLRNNIPRNDRLDILKKCIKWLATKNYLNVITVQVDKTRNPNPFEAAWRTLIQRFENTLRFQNFPNPAFNTDLGVIVSDNTDGKKTTALLRKMRRINFIPSRFAGSPARNIPIRFVIKDPVFRDSRHSYLIQFSDVVVYFARQYFTPNSFIRKKAAKNYYQHLTPIINQSASSSAAHHRIIRV